MTEPTDDSPEYLAERVHQAVTTDPRTTEQGVQVRVTDAELFLYGEVDEAELVCRAVGDPDLPVVAVLEGSSTVVDVDGCTVGIAGVKGFGGGFAGACASNFGEPEMKAFVPHTKDIADQLCRTLAELPTDVQVALLHWSPVEGTLRGERLEIFPFLGSYLLAEAIDAWSRSMVGRRISA